MMIFIFVACNNNDVLLPPLSEVDDWERVQQQSSSTGNERESNEEHDKIGLDESTEKWPDNQYTQQVPKPIAGALISTSLLANDGGFNISIIHITGEDFNTYMKSCLSAGWSKVEGSDSFNATKDNYGIAINFYNDGMNILINKSEKLSSKNIKTEVLKDDTDKKTVKCLVGDKTNYSGNYCSFQVQFSELPSKAFLIIDDNMDEFPSTEINISDIQKEDTQYVFSQEWRLHTEGEHTAKAIAYYDNVIVESDIDNFTIVPIPKQPKTKIGYDYWQVVPVIEGKVKPKINLVSTKINDSGYTLKIEDYTCDKEAIPFFYWKIKNGEFVDSSDDFKTVYCTIDKSATVEAYIGDGLGWVASYTITLKTIK